LTANKAFGLQLRNQQIAIAKMKIEQARLVDGVEGTTTTDIPVDWMEARRTGGGSRWSGYGLGGDDYGGGWSAVGFCDGTAY
jgi:hypothetical protein